MPAPPSLLRLLTFLVTMLAPLAAFATDEPAPVGFVDKVENEAKVVSGDSGATAIIGTPVHMKDELRTGAEGRLQVTFRDNTVLTLGEKGERRHRSLCLRPGSGCGRDCAAATKGVFRFASGRIKGLKQSNIAVSTPVADIGVRGTEFWGGPMDQKYGVLLLEGEVTVSNQAGSATLSTPGQGTDIPSPLDAPRPVQGWSADKIARAVASVALH